MDLGIIQDYYRVIDDIVYGQVECTFLKIKVYHQEIFLLCHICTGLLCICSFVAAVICGHQYCSTWLTSHLLNIANLPICRTVRPRQGQCICKSASPILFLFLSLCMYVAAIFDPYSPTRLRNLTSIYKYETKMLTSITCILAPSFTLKVRSFSHSFDISTTWIADNLQCTNFYLLTNEQQI